MHANAKKIQASPPKPCDAIWAIFTFYQMRKDYLRGMMFPTVCGGATGSVNVYTIDADKVQAAQARGFGVFQNKK